MRNLFLAVFLAACGPGAKDLVDVNSVAIRIAKCQTEAREANRAAPGTGLHTYNQCKAREDLP